MRRNIIGQKLQQQIDTNNGIRYSDTIAEITAYDAIRNTASIRFVNPNNGFVMTANNVAVKIETGGFTRAALSIGQKCIVSFIGNNLLSPIITSLCDDLYYDNVYSKKTNADQGAFLIDTKINEIDMDSIEISPMIEDYDSTCVATKYTLVSKDYTDMDAQLQSRQVLMQLDKYKENEEGITNISTNSTVKFKENGDIDIFVSGNIGIRISPVTKTIECYGGFLVNGKEIGGE